MVGYLYGAPVVNVFSYEGILVNGETVDYFESPASGANGYHKTLAELKSLDFFTYTGSEEGLGVNWSISSSNDERKIWYLDEGNVFPVFQWQAKDAPAPPPTPPNNYLKVILEEARWVTTDPVPGDYFIKEGESFSFTVTLDCNHLKDTVVVMTDRGAGEELKPDAAGKYVLPDIRQAETIHIALKPYREPVGNETLTDGISIWGVGGRLHLSLLQPETIAVYTVSGLLIRKGDFSAGDHALPLSSGLYLIRTSSGQTVKVQL